MRIKRQFLVLAFLIIPTIGYAFSWQSIVQWFTNLNNENSAWAVHTKQTSIVSNQIASSNMRSNQMLSVALQTIAQTERQKKIIIDFSVAFGQPESNLCVAIARQNSFVKNMGNHKLDVVGRMSNFINTSVDSEVQQKQITQKVHSDFCSISEAKLGLCKLKPNGMQSWDTDYSAFTSKNNLEGRAEVGAIAYVRRMSVPPVIKSNNCKSTSCAQARIHNMGNVARSSIVTHTLLSQISIRKNSDID